MAAARPTPKATPDAFQGSVCGSGDCLSYVGHPGIEGSWRFAIYDDWTTPVCCLCGAIGSIAVGEDLVSLSLSLLDTLYSAVEAAQAAAAGLLHIDFARRALRMAVGEDDGLNLELDPSVSGIAGADGADVPHDIAGLYHLTKDYKTKAAEWLLQWWCGRSQQWLLQLLCLACNKALHTADATEETLKSMRMLVPFVECDKMHSAPRIWLWSGPSEANKASPACRCCKNGPKYGVTNSDKLIALHLIQKGRCGLCNNLMEQPVLAGDAFAGWHMDFRSCVDHDHDRAEEDGFPQRKGERKIVDGVERLGAERHVRGLLCNVCNTFEGSVRKLVRHMRIRTRDVPISGLEKYLDNFASTMEQPTFKLFPPATPDGGVAWDLEPDEE